MTFTVGLSNPSNGLTYNQARINLTIQNATQADITSMEYLLGSTWMTIQLTQSGANDTGLVGLSGGFQLNPGDSQAITLRANWAQPGTYSVKFDLTGISYTDRVMASTSFSSHVYNPPLTSLNSLNLPFLANNTYTFNVGLANPSAPNGNSIAQADLLFTFLNTNLADIGAFNYESADKWLNLTLVQSGANVVGAYPVTGSFALSPGMVFISWKLTLSSLARYPCPFPRDW